MKYFNPLMSDLELKKRYKKLAFIHHPDRGGEKGVMQEINIEFADYMNLSGSFNATHSDKMGVRTAHLILGALVDISIRKPKINTTCDLIFETMQSLKNAIKSK